MAASNSLNSSPMLDVSEVNRLFNIAAILTFIFWLILLFALYALTPSEEWKPLNGLERQVTLITSIALITSFIFFMMPFVGFLRAGQPTYRQSGIIVATIVNLFITIATNLLLAFAPTVVMIDPVIGGRVFLVRWCEWIPLAGLLTFLSEAVDTRRERGGIWRPTLNSIAQVLSTACGMAFPFCPNQTAWIGLQCVALILFFPIFHRVETKRQELAAEPSGISYVQKEMSDRRFFAYHLLKQCAVVWTLLVVMYYAHAFSYMFLPDGHPLRHPSSAMILDGFFDFVSKSLFLQVIVDVHRKVFDSDARARSHLGELRRLMQLLWDSTTDTIIISLRGDERTSAFLSPSFPSLVGVTPTVTDKARFPGVLLQETTVKSGCSRPPEILNAKYINSSHISSNESIENLAVSSIQPDAMEVQIATRMVNACWNGLGSANDGGSLLLLHEFVKPDGEKCFCELKVSQKAQESFVAIIRDVSERYRRFEAEQLAHAEALARQRDAQNANRFTRHEIKNGLLAGIELCEGLQRAMDESESSDKICRIVNQVNGALHEILDTVLSEAMARDVIHECYKPQPKETDIVAVLRSQCGGAGMEERFPLRLAPCGDVPKLMLDSQLLRSIHRNAVSNACKYGKPGGVVTTNVHYHQKDHLLRMDVVNEPGPGHDTLLEMGSEAGSAVFESGTRLHNDANLDETDKSLSSGDGAWIMQKCAKNMGGTCSIDFEIDRTVLRFCCKVEPCLNEPKQWDKEPFTIPSETLAFGIDDSWIQRKILVRIFSNCGIPDERMRVLGRTLEELDSAGQLLSECLDENPSTKCLILVDENLDYADDGGAHRIIRSGSKMIEKILNGLPQQERGRVLTLVRSANDSVDDVAMYTHRTDGFCPKTVTRKEDVLEVLAPVWESRFGAQRATAIKRSNQSPSENESVDRDDLRQIVYGVDALLKDKPFQEVPWPNLWSSLHSLKGDIMIIDDPVMKWATAEIGSMRGSTAPEDFEERWSEIRKNIMDAIDRM